MSFDEIANLLVKDLTKDEISFEKLEKILKTTDQGHLFFKIWLKDRQIFQNLKMNPVFHGHISDSKKGWFDDHDFPITLEILNRVLTPGGEVIIHSFGGEKRDLLVYHALCPELENFVTLIVWIDTQSSMNAWKQISELVSEKDNQKVLQFSNKCGILLPNRIHPSHDQESSLVTKEFYEALYDWRIAHYLFDDGKSIIAHNSPLNYRRIILDEWNKKEVIAEMRTTIGRLIAIKKTSIDVSIPCIFGPPITRTFHRAETLKDELLKENSLYNFQIFKIAGSENMETHVRSISETSSVDIVGMFLSYSAYLLHLGNMRLKILDPQKFEKLFNLYYDQSARFCNRNNDELDTMNHLDWKTIQFGFTSSFTKWIGSELYVVPPILRRFLSKFDSETNDTIIKKFDESLASKNHACFSDIPYNSLGNRMFSRAEKAKINKFYDYTNFLINEKKFILKIHQHFVRPSQRDEQISWLNNTLKSS